jgi:hypothetical protein
MASKDIFDNKILCGKCNKVMKKSQFLKENFVFRCVKCEDCKSEIIHPVDMQEYEKFKDLKRKTYKVKLRLVGNSYAVSIPKEIVSFMRDQERAFNDIDNMVRLCFDQVGKLTLNFHDEINSRVKRFR